MKVRLMRTPAEPLKMRNRLHFKKKPAALQIMSGILKKARPAIANRA